MLDAFQESAFTADGITHPVLRAGGGPALELAFLRERLVPATA